MKRDTMRMETMQDLEQLMYGAMNMNHVLQGYFYVGSVRVELSESVQKIAFELLKKYVVDKCRNGSKMQQKLCGVKLENVEDFGIFNRLVLNCEEGKAQAQYNCGQSFPEELQTLKKCLLKVKK